MGVMNKNPNRKWYLLAFAASMIQQRISDGESLGYTTPELASLFNVNPRTITRWKKDAYNRLNNNEMSINLLNRGNRLREICYVGGSKELEQIERRNVWKRPMTK